LNAEGVFQTTPRFGGKIMEKSSISVEEYHEGIRVRAIQISHGEGKGNSARQIVATAWLKEPRWMLVVKQGYEEVFAEVNYANNASLVFLHICAFSILIITVLTTRYFVKVIKRRDTEADQLNRQLMEAGKMASIGELSAGVAHEINNPLAIILTEKQILLDMAEYTPELNEEFKKALMESMAQVDTQVNRCKRITHNLLRFSRRTRSVVEKVDLNPFLKEVVDLMEREARSSGIKFLMDLDENLKPVMSDPSQLQQVFLISSPTPSMLTTESHMGPSALSPVWMMKTRECTSHLQTPAPEFRRRLSTRFSIPFSPPRRWVRAQDSAFPSVTALCSGWAEVSR